MGQAKILVRFFGTLADKFGAEQWIVLSAPLTLEHLLGVLSVDPGALALVAVNNRQVGGEAEFVDGDCVMLIPHIIGG